MARRRSSFEDMLHIASRSQMGALAVGAFGLVLASPIPHAILDSLTSGPVSDDPYVAISGNGMLGAFYMMIPWVRFVGFVLAGAAVLIMLIQGRNPSYRSHLSSGPANAGAAAILASFAIILGVQDPPKLAPGSRETAEAMAAFQARRAGPVVARPSERRPATGQSAEASDTFPASGTVQWGDEQPIGGNMGQLDIWDETRSPQDKIVNVRSGYVVPMPGVQTPPYVTIYIRAGDRASIRLPADRPYRITAMSGDRWMGRDRLFGSDATVVDFGMIVPNARQPQAVVMGAPDQTATVVPASRF